MSFQLPIYFEGAKGGAILNVISTQQMPLLSVMNGATAFKTGYLHSIRKPRMLIIPGSNIEVEATHAVLADFYINGIRLSDELFIVPGLQNDVMMGAATIRKWRIRLNFERHSAFVDPKVAKLQLI